MHSELTTIAKYLSDDQLSILEWLFDNVPTSNLAPWGIRWQPGKWGLTDSPSSRAAYSRTLKRLEVKGLVLRQNQTSGSPVTQEARRSSAEPHNRTTHVLLTELGVQVSKWLTKDETSFVNREDSE